MSIATRCRFRFDTIHDAGGTKTAMKLSAALASAAALAALAAAFLSSEPASALRAFFLAPLRTRTAFLSTLELAAPLAVCALGVIVTFRAGHYSLGGEGQAYAGAFAAALAAPILYESLGPASAPLAILVGALAGAIVSAPSAIGKRLAGADVLLTSILVSQGVIFAVDWAIGGPFRDQSSNLVAMRAIPRGALLPRLAPPSTLTAASIVALAACLIAAFYFERTRSGTAHDLYGRNQRFAELQGFDVARLSWAPIVAAGVLHGAAGAMMALGARGTAIRGMSGGIGWSAIGAALVAGSRPQALPFAALLFAWLDSGSRQAAILSDLPPDAGQAIKAIVILAVSARPAIAALRRRR